MIDVIHDGIYGKLFLPTNCLPARPVIVLGGSGGGLSWSADVAAKLSQAGYAALALAYFRHPGLPANLANIPLEYFENAIRWFTTQPNTDCSQLAVIGASRGAELALLLAATFPEIKAVVGYCPSSVVWGPIGGWRAWKKSAWTYAGKPVPTMRMGSGFAAIQARARNISQWIMRRPIATTPCFEAALHSAAAVQSATIHVERITGPILLISGTDDQLWPSSQMAE